MAILTPVPKHNGNAGNGEDDDRVDKEHILLKYDLCKKEKRQCADEAQPDYFPEG